MILFFSATGNSRYAASRIAEATGQKIVSIVDCVREDRYVFENEEIGIVSPTYDWGLPSIVREFLEKASFRTGYLYFAATYGTTPGASGSMANKAGTSTLTTPSGWSIHGRRSLIFPHRKR